VVVTGVFGWKEWEGKARRDASEPRRALDSVARQPTDKGKSFVPATHESWPNGPSDPERVG